MHSGRQTIATSLASLLRDGAPRGPSSCGRAAEQLRLFALPHRRHPLRVQGVALLPLPHSPGQPLLDPLRHDVGLVLQPRLHDAAHELPPLLLDGPHHLADLVGGVSRVEDPVHPDLLGDPELESRPPLVTPHPLPLVDAAPAGEVLVVLPGQGDGRAGRDGGVVPQDAEILADLDGGEAHPPAAAGAHRHVGFGFGPRVPRARVGVHAVVRIGYFVVSDGDNFDHSTVVVKELEIYRSWMSVLRGGGGAPDRD
mmetsp:Transcript_41808/g.89088  ORF Transcript_41808/g.89088 Transcript_41808/m.89088 type:complete len:254 (+) Transcript_41808:151-912(+)